jgi:manganese/zinc/iron transport system ATP- binding protein
MKTTQSAIGLPAVEIDGLTVAYRTNVALQDVNLVIPPKTVMGFIGPNGAGKTTLLKAILDLVPRRRGRVSIFGKPFSASRKMVGYVPQRSTVDWDFPISVFELVLMGTYGELGWFRRPGKEQKRRAHNALQQLGMLEYADRQIGELSGGQQQRAFLARAFVQDAQIYFLDEPFTGVDMLTERTIVEFLHQMRDNGKTIVVVQHDLSTVGAYLDHITLINRTVVASGPVTTTFTRENIDRTYLGSIKRPGSTALNGAKEPSLVLEYANVD